MVKWATKVNKNKHFIKMINKWSVESSYKVFSRGTLFQGMAGMFPRPLTKLILFIHYRMFYSIKIFFCLLNEFERNSEQAHIPRAPSILDNTTHNELNCIIKSNWMRENFSQNNNKILKSKVPKFLETIKKPAFPLNMHIYIPYTLCRNLQSLGKFLCRS